VLVATAGHVDHGKTTLVRALTGVETDRLPDEKRRGLTIDLGFAYHRDASGSVLGFVDVPGHERFVRNMLAGVGAIDVAMLVVAADDGPMPQTHEHLAILELLEIEQLIIVVTRIDLVERAQLDAVRASVTRLLASTRWKEATRIFEVNAPAGEGIDVLRQYLLDAVEQRERHVGNGYFRLAIDRAFTVTGSGTVVTGAVVCGEVRTGDELNLLPSGTGTRIRSIHADGQNAERGQTGQRLALNIAGIERDAVRRGDWLVAPQCQHISARIHVEFDLLDTEPRSLRHWTPVHFHAGTASVPARVALTGARRIEKGTRAFAELRLEEPQHVLFGDRFVLRDQSASRTIGGGRVLHPFALERAGRESTLLALAQRDHSHALAQLLQISDDGFPTDAFRIGRNLSESDLEALLNQNKATSLDGFMYAEAMRELTMTAINEQLLAFHADRPTETGVEESELRMVIGYRRRTRLFAVALADLLRTGKVLREGSRLRLTDFTPTLLPDQQKLLDRVVRVLTPQTTQPPSLSGLAESLGEERLSLADQLAALVDGGHLVRVATNRYYHPLALDTLIDIAQKLAASSDRGVFNVRAFRDSAGIGRNVSIEVLEHFDRIGVTRRIGDGRSIRRYGKNPNPH